MQHVERSMLLVEACLVCGAATSEHIRLRVDDTVPRLVRNHGGEHPVQVSCIHPLRCCFDALFVSED